MVGTEFSLFSERLRGLLGIVMRPLLSTTMLEFHREKYGDVYATACHGEEDSDLMSVGGS